MLNLNAACSVPPRAVVKSIAKRSNQQTKGEGVEQGEEGEEEEEEEEEEEDNEDGRGGGGRGG
eukprot:2525810-Pyramimonas_sp.AAC.1